MTINQVQFCCILIAIDIWMIFVFFFEPNCMQITMHRRKKFSRFLQWLFSAVFLFVFVLWEKIIINQWQFAIDLWHDNTRQWRLTAKSNFFILFPSLFSLAPNRWKPREKVAMENFLLLHGKVFWLNFCFLSKGVKLECKFLQRKIHHSII